MDIGAPGVEADRALAVRDSLVEPAKFGEGNPEIEVRLRHAGARDRRRLERGRGGIEDFLPEQCGAEAEMRRRQAGVEAQRLPETAGGFAEPARAQIGVAEIAMITGVPVESSR